MSRAAFTFQTVIGADGKVELTVPLPVGARVEVVILGAPQDDFADLVEASQTSTDFWDNLIDDAEWNHA
jgi:hypothetical protein